MSRYRRWFVPGGTYFFTLVVLDRRPLFNDADARTCLHHAIKEIRDRHPFEIVAQVLLPNHLHAIWSLPSGDDRYPTRWRRIKEEFTKRFLGSGGMERRQSASRREAGYRGIWQKRYWEHSCGAEADLRGCVDYVHYNPKKHGLVANVRDWPYSTFHRFVELGEYSESWGAVDPMPGYDAPEWGE
jgi:putative transposase